MVYINIFQMLRATVDPLMRSKALKIRANFWSMVADDVGNNFSSIPEAIPDSEDEDEAIHFKEARDWLVSNLHMKI